MLADGDGTCDGMMSKANISQVDVRRWDNERSDVVRMRIDVDESEWAMTRGGARVSKRIRDEMATGKVEVVKNTYVEALMVMET